MKPLTSLFPFLLWVFILTLNFSLWPPEPEIFLHVQISHFHPIPRKQGSDLNSCSSWGKHCQRDKHLECLDWCPCSWQGAVLVFISTIPLFWIYTGAEVTNCSWTFPIPSKAKQWTMAPLRFSPWPYLCLASATWPCQHSRTMRECHVCNPTGRGVS